MTHTASASRLAARPLRAASRGIRRARAGSARSRPGSFRSAWRGHQLRGSAAGGLGRAGRLALGRCSRGRFGLSASRPQASPPGRSRPRGASHRRRLNRGRRPTAGVGAAGVAIAGVGVARASRPGCSRWASRWATVSRIFFASSIAIFGVGEPTFIFRHEEHTEPAVQSGTSHHDRKPSHKLATSKFSSQAIVSSGKKIARRTKACRDPTTRSPREQSRSST